MSDKRKRERGARKQKKKKKKQRKDGLLHSRTTYHLQRVESVTR
jgi:hypothetical protein